jgi:prepilin-type N-terminal cleavage/methylation domain-containing protein
MSNLNSPSRQQFRFRRGAARGFTLIELLVTMAVFLVLGLAAMSLASQSASISVAQQSQATLNVGIRNVTAQLQTDITNAGTGYFPTYNIPGAPLGVVITHGTGATAGYDTLTVLSFDPTIVSNPTGSVNTTSGTMTVAPISPMTEAQLQAGYNTGNELMMFTNDVNATTGLPTVTTFQLTANGAQSGSNVTLAYTANGTANTPSGAGTWPGDPLDISSTCADLVNCYLGNSFDTADWVLKTISTVYSVDTTDPTHPLYRQVNNGTKAALANNVMGFQVGALLYNGTDATSYTYGAITDPRQIRAIRVSFITHTTPNPTSPFTNSFDGGHYRVEGTSIIINPRNLSLHD